MVENHVHRRVDRLNTPNSENVEGLCRDFLALPAILNGCRWQNKSAQAVREDLDSLVHDVRGEIVHKGRTITPLGLRECSRGATSLGASWSASTSTYVRSFRAPTESSPGP